MMNAGFTELLPPLLPLLLLGLLAILLVVAAVIDVRTFTISNRLNLAVALLAPLYWLAVGLPLWPDAAVQLAVAAALALWFSPASTLQFLVLMSLAGGVLTLGVMIAHRLRKKPGKPEIPYGVAIAFGGLVILAQRFLNQFA